MAKGIRSKCKRAARTELRKALSIPLMKKQTERAAHALTEGLKQKQHQDTLTGLRKVLAAQKPKKGGAAAASSSSSSSSGAAATADEEEEDEDEEGDEVEMAADTAAAAAPKSNAAVAKEAFIKRKGSKPRNNPGKELVWF
jgi:hypothetical protein